MPLKGRSKDNQVGPPAKPKLRFGFVLAPRFTLTALAGFIDAIRLAADDGDRSRPIDCDWVVLGDPNTYVESSCGLTVKTWTTMTDPKRFDYIVVVGGLLHGGQKVVPGTYSFLKLAARSGVPLIGLCTGSFILARAGLLNGYEVCVSRFHKDEFEDEFPDLRIQANRKFVMDRDRLTCAGGTSVVHVAAHLIEKHFGRSLALKSVRLLVEEEVLPSSVWQPAAVITHQAHDSIVRQAMLAIEQDLADPQPLTKLAETLDVSMSQVERRFKSDIGISPREYRMKLRLDRAKWMVEHTDHTMTDIGLECGFNGGAYFSRVFKERFGVQPTDARHKAQSRKIP